MICCPKIECSMNEEDLTVDDILGDINENSDEIEELSNAIESLRDEIPNEAEIPEVEGGVPTEEDVQAQVRGMIEHLATEDCDSEWCDDMRGRFGMTHPDDDGDVEEEDPEEEEAEQGPDHDPDDEEPEEEEADDGGDDDDDGPVTNVFGEPI